LHQQVKSNIIFKRKTTDSIILWDYEAKTIKYMYRKQCVKNFKKKDKHDRLQTDVRDYETCMQK